MTEFIPVSLYEVLHRDHFKLARREVSLIAIDILLALQFLHSKGESFGSSLTSRKVLLASHNRVKLRRFGVDFVLRAAREGGGGLLDHLPDTSSFWKTQYEAAAISTSEPPLSTSTEAMPGHDGLALDREPNGRSRSAQAQKQDVFAFGMLLLEMCTSEKPTSEIFNRISSAEQLDPVFGRVVRLALSCGGLSIETGEPKRNESLIDSAIEASASSFLKLLTENEAQRPSEESRLSSASFPSFLHADRYFIAIESQQVERSLQMRESHFQVATKRLGAVEQELIEEQSNFEVLVRQFEKLQQERAQSVKENAALETEVQALVVSRDATQAQATRLVQVAELQSERMERFQMHIEDIRYGISKLQDEKLADMMEKQSFLLEILKLKDAKRKVQNEKIELITQITELATKVGSEKDAMEDLEGRWKQVTFKWEQEQRARRKAERQHEMLNIQLVTMEEERSMYSFELKSRPTGLLDPQQATSYVLKLKEKEILGLYECIKESKQRENEQQLRITQQQRVQQGMSDAQHRLQEGNEKLETHRRALSDRLETKNDEIVRLTDQLRSTKAQVSALTEKLADFEEELERQANKRTEEGKITLYFVGCTEILTSQGFLVVHKQRKPDAFDSASRRSVTRQSSSLAPQDTAKSARRERESRPYCRLQRFREGNRHEPLRFLRIAASAVWTAPLGASRSVATMLRMCKLWRSCGRFRKYKSWATLRPRSNVMMKRENYKTSARKCSDLSSN